MTRLVVRHCILLSFLVVTQVLFVTTDPAAQTQPPLRLGATLQMTGFGAIYGDWVKKGLTFSIDEINEAGGVLGRRVELVIDDLKSEVKEAVVTYERQTKVEKLNIIFSHGSPSIMAQRPLAIKDKVLLINVGAATSKFRGKELYTVSTAQDFASNVRPLPQYMWKQGYRRVAMSYTANDIGEACRQPFVDGWKALGGTVVAQEGHEAGQTDYRAQLTKIKAASPDAIMFCGNVTEVALQIRAMPQLGLSVPKFGPYSLDTPQYWEITGQEAGEGLIFASLAFSKQTLSAPGLAWWNRWNARFSEDPSMFALVPYVGMRVLKEAIQRCQCTDPTGVAKAWHTIREFPTVLGPATVDEDGYLSWPQRLKKASQGQFTFQD